MKKLLILVLACCTLSTTLQATEKNKGEFSNLVVFLRFADEDEAIFEKPASHYEKMFNDSTEEAQLGIQLFQRGLLQPTFLVEYLLSCCRQRGKNHFVPSPKSARILREAIEHQSRWIYR